MTKCPCGEVILADTEEWSTPICYNCFSDVDWYTENTKLNKELSECRSYLVDAVARECKCENIEKVNISLLDNNLKYRGLIKKAIIDGISFYTNTCPAIIKADHGKRARMIITKLKKELGEDK